MIQFVMQHQFAAGVGLVWVISAAVSAMQEPDASSTRGYRWLFRFAHTIAGNIKTVFGGKIPGLN